MIATCLAGESAVTSMRFLGRFFDGLVELIW
jgi:hypothetical protein